MGLSRRRFLAALAALPLAPRALDAALQEVDLGVQTSARVSL